MVFMISHMLLLGLWIVESDGGDGESERGIVEILITRKIVLFSERKILLFSEKKSYKILSGYG